MLERRAAGIRGGDRRGRRGRKYRGQRRAPAPGELAARADALCRPGQPPDGPRQAFGEPQPHPDRGQDEQQREAEIDEAELEQHPPARRFELLVEADGLARVVEQAEDLAVHVTADIEIAVDIGRQRNEGAELVHRPVLDQHRLAIGGAPDLLLARFLEVEEIAALAARLQVAEAVDHIGLAQAALDQGLALRQQLPEIGIRDEEVLPLGAFKVVRQRVGVGDEVAAVFLLIGLGGLERGAHHAAHPVREPAFETDIHRQTGEDRDQDRRHQRDAGKDPCQPQVQSRARRFRPPRGDHLREAREDERPEQQEVDQVGQKDQPQRVGIGPLPQGAEDDEGRQRQERAENDEAERQHVLEAPLPAQAVEPLP